MSHAAEPVAGKPVEAGVYLCEDVFPLQPKEGMYLFGRVIRNDANAGEFPNSNLIYIYATPSNDKNMTPRLHRADCSLH
jgi:hypothetical protein